jgi:hypothetical protein
MYLQNKYTNWYNSIVFRAQNRKIIGYVERHHILPKSLGGTNEKHNLVELTAREHFICHLLLTKMTVDKDRNKMISAVFFLTGKGKSDRNNKTKSSRLYEKLKKDHAKNVGNQKRGCKQPPRTAQAKQRLSASKTGKLNPNFLGIWVTPWGNFESSRLAAKSCPKSITANSVHNFCQKKNNVPISYLSVCRSKGWISRDHIGKTPAELGFRININYSTEKSDENT